MSEDKSVENKNLSENDLIKKKIEQNQASDNVRYASSDTGGVRLMWLESRFESDRERLSDAFTEEQRKYRVKYLKSLELHHDEPFHVPEYERELLNPIRRAYMQPMSWVERNVIQRYITDNKYNSSVIRVTISRGLMVWVALTGLYYHFKYNHNTWESTSGPRIRFSAPRVVMGDPEYPFKDPRTDRSDFYEFGFKSRKVFVDHNKYNLIPK